MDQQWAQPEVTVGDGVLTGPYRAAVLHGQEDETSIHNPDVAARVAGQVGFHGAPVASRYHLDLFPRLLLHAFGPRWFEVGSISMYYRNPVVEGERVRARMELPPEGTRDVQVNGWVERDDGTRVVEGSVSVGDVAEPSALRARDLARFDPGELRISPYRDGEVLESGEVTFGEGWDEGPPIDRPAWPGGGSPFGGSLASLAALGLMHHVEYHPEGCTGIAGACEVRFVRGPILEDTPYTASLEVVHVGQTPKTELIWFDNRVTDGDGNVIAELRRMFRWVKATHPAYQ